MTGRRERIRLWSQRRPWTAWTLEMAASMVWGAVFTAVADTLGLPWQAGTAVAVLVVIALAVLRLNPFLQPYDPPLRRRAALLWHAWRGAR